MLDFIVRYHLGDIASLAGVMISIVGFAVTLEGVRRSRGAAQMAREAAESARNSIRAFETAVDVSGAITLLEELKVAHRKNDWATMPSRYTTLRKKLIGVRAAGGFTDEQSAVFQATISDLKQMEIMVERALPDGSPKTPHKFNERVSDHIDDLTKVLAQIRMTQTGA